MSVKFVKLHQVGLGTNRTIYVNPLTVSLVYEKSDDASYLALAGSAMIAVDGSLKDILNALETETDFCSRE